MDDFHRRRERDRWLPPITAGEIGNRVQQGFVTALSLEDDGLHAELSIKVGEKIAGSHVGVMACFDGATGHMYEVQLTSFKMNEIPFFKIPEMEVPLKSWERTDALARPSADLTWLKVAAQIAERSTCPDDARHGCVLVKDGYVLSVGYGSPARGVAPCSECWLRKKKRETGIKDWTVCPSVHAEVNAVASAARWGVSVEGTTAYIARGRPCAQCYRVLANAGVEQYVNGVDMRTEIRAGDDVMKAPAEGGMA